MKTINELYESNPVLKIRIDEYRERQGFSLDLSNFSLDSNQLALLIPELQNFEEMKVLDLVGNDLRTLPESVGQLTNLKTLYLGRNELRTLPANIGQLTNLHTLSLSSNQLETLPESIGQLTNLEELRLGRNQLETLPEIIGQLTNLKTLDLVNTKLETLPESIGQLTNLKTLYLGRNQLETLPEIIGQLTNLHTLSLSSNQLETLPESIGRLTNLSISLENNPLLQETIRWIDHNRENHNNSLSIDYDMSAYTIRNDIDTSLQKLYPNNPIRVAGIRQAIDGLSQEKTYTIDNGTHSKDVSAKEVFMDFLSRGILFSQNDSNSLVLASSRQLLDSIFDEQTLDDSKKTALSKLTTVLGNCNTPIMSYLITTYLEPHYEKLRNGESLDAITEVLIEREALEMVVRDKLTPLYLSGINSLEQIEKVQALVNTVFLADAESNAGNPNIRIEGDRLRLSSKSAYPDFGFNQVNNNNELLIKDFLKLVCKVDNGNLLKTKAGLYILDSDKLKTLKEDYLYKQGIMTSLVKEVCKNHENDIRVKLEEFRAENQDTLDFNSVDTLDFKRCSPKEQLKNLQDVLNAVEVIPDELKESYRARLEEQANVFDAKLDKELAERVNPFDQFATPQVVKNERKASEGAEGAIQRKTTEKQASTKIRRSSSSS